MDRYADFDELKQHESQGRDYTILYREAEAAIAIFAPHGGGIEPGTIDIADAVAGSDYPFYAFKGIKKLGNNRLHITSRRFDEPIAVRTAQNARVVVTVHGCRDSREIVFIGGGNQPLKHRIQRALQAAGFQAEICRTPGYQGTHPKNICNRCQSGKGVQLEISRGLRDRMHENLGHRQVRKRTRTFYQFVSPLRQALSKSRDGQ